MGGSGGFGFFKMISELVEDTGQELVASVLRGQKI